MRMIVCGGRDDHLTQLGKAALWGLSALYGPTLTVVHGAARGVDREAAAYCKQLGVDVEPHPADWRGRGVAAGPERNRAMLDAGPIDLVLAVKARFDWSLERGGSENMVALAKAAGVPAYVLQRVGP